MMVMVVMVYISPFCAFLVEFIENLFTNEFCKDYE
jgi:hypothetical protein